MRTCRVCKHKKDLSEFYLILKRNKAVFSYRCKECARKYACWRDSRIYFPETEKICSFCKKSFSTNKRLKVFCKKLCGKRASTKRRLEIWRIQVIEKLGGKCTGCGISDIDVLQFDHILPIKETGEKRIRNRLALFGAILKNKLINIQLLCANCHMKKTNGKV